MARRATGAIAYPISGLLALGCFVLLLLPAPQLPARDRAITADAALPATPSPLPSPAVLATSHDDAPPLEVPAAAGAGSVDLAISLELPHDDKMVERALPDRAEQASPQPSAVAAGPDVTAAADATGGPARASPGDAVPVMAEPQRDGGPADDATDEKLFHEFMQWRAARAGGVAQARPQPARTRIRPAQLAGLVTPAPSPGPPRPVRSARPRPPASVDPIGWPTSLRAVRPPRDPSRDPSQDPSRDPSRAARTPTRNPAP